MAIIESDVESSSEPDQTMENQEPEAKVGSDAESSSKPVQTMENQEPEAKVGRDAESSSEPDQTMENQEPEAKVGNDAESSSDSANAQRWHDYVENFMVLVKETFERQPETYKEFIQLTLDFKNLRISSDRLFFEVHLLFKEHKDLLKGFNEFLPENYNVCRELDFDTALAFTDKVERRFSKEPNVFESFLQILLNWRRGNYDRADTFVKISKLFEGHQDLLLEYWEYVPPII